MKMKDIKNRNLSSKNVIDESRSIPEENGYNLQGYLTYSQSDELRLVTMLNTLKLQSQFYRDENSTIEELCNLIERIASNNPYFVAQAIVYSRCMGEGMRSINHLAAAVLSPFISGLEWGKRFYGPFIKGKNNGCIFRPDDMSEIKDALYAFGRKGLPSAVRQGFKSAIESFDTYRLAKYKKSIIDVSNLVHPDPNKSNATYKDENGDNVNALNAIMRGMSVVADTWESGQSKAGQDVAKLVREGILSEEDAKEALAEAKSENWEHLLNEGKLGILAALRNIKNIIESNIDDETIEKWCNLIQNDEIIRKNLVLPIYFDLAFDILDCYFKDYEITPKLKMALQNGYSKSIPNLSKIFTGKTCIIIDCSGSMGMPINEKGIVIRGRNSTFCCSYKAGLIAATIAKSSNADIVKFGSKAAYFNYNRNENVFSLAKKIGTSEFGCTNPASAWHIICGKKYDRIIFISDNEVNSYNLTSSAYKEYIRTTCSPYVYAIDLAAYGTTPLAGNKVAYFYGYGPSLYEDMTKHEFNAEDALEKIRKIVI